MPTTSMGLTQPIGNSRVVHLITSRRPKDLMLHVIDAEALVYELQHSIRRCAEQKPVLLTSSAAKRCR